MKLIVLTVFAATLAAPAGAAIYKWVDENGAVRFSDKRPAEQQAQVFVPRTSVGTSFDKGNDPAATQEPADHVEPVRIKHSGESDFDRHLKEVNEKNRLQAEADSQRVYREVQDARKAERRKNKFIREHPEYQQNVKPLTLEQRRRLGYAW